VRARWQDGKPPGPGDGIAQDMRSVFSPVRPNAA